MPLTEQEIRRLLRKLRELEERIEQLEALTQFQAQLIHTALQPR